MRRWGIQARVMFLALTPSVMIMLALVGYFTYERIREAESSLSERGSLLVQRLVPGVEFALFAGDVAAMQRLADTARGEADVHNVTIRDADGSVLVHSGPRNSLPAGSASRLSRDVVRTRLVTTDFPEEATPQSKPARIGEVTVTMSRAATDARQRRLVVVALALGALCLALAIALALAIGKGVTRPVRHLAGAMVALEQGQRDVLLPVGGGGEFETLSTGFNRMAARLQAQALDLEARVHEATRALLQQKEAAEQATNAKSRFIAAASHDLRQPLHAIGLFTATLQRRTEGSELQALVEDLSRAVLAMDRLLNSLLDISRLDAGSLRADPRPFPLQRLFTQLEAEFADGAAQKRLRLHVAETDAVLDTDELLLHRILGNLVANAIRYTDAGSVMVCCRWRSGGVEVQVRDSGIGIPQDEQARIFHEFYQLASANRDQAMGLGLGLAIVSRLSRLLGTSVVVHSAPGRGSVFSLRLPRGDLPAEATPRDRPALPDAAPGRPLRVIVIDDDALVLAGSRGLLQALGCDVATYADADAAEAAVAAHDDRPLLVLCDVWLADGRNGIEVLRRLSSRSTALVAAILISGDTRPETLQAATAAGFPLLHKPVSPARLRAVVTHYAQRHAGSDAVGSSDEDPAG